MTLVDLRAGSLLVTLDDDSVVRRVSKHRAEVSSPLGTIEIDVEDPIASDLMRRLSLGPICLDNVVGGAWSPRLRIVLRALSAQLALSMTIAGDWRPIITLTPTTAPGFAANTRPMVGEKMAPVPGWRLHELPDEKTLNLVAPAGTCRARLQGPGRRVASAIATGARDLAAVAIQGDVGPDLAGDVLTLLLGARLVAPHPGFAYHE